MSAANGRFKNYFSAYNPDFGGEIVYPMKSLFISSGSL
jgi:hypothetical protein